MERATQLGNNMRQLANEGHPQAMELRAVAEAFEAATDILDPHGNAKPGSVDREVYKRFLAAWAKARRLYAECAGIDPHD